MSVAPPTVASIRELLVDDLKRLLTVEAALAKLMLPKLVQEASDTELQETLEQHHHETQRHLQNIKAAFAELREDAAGKSAPALDGLKEEHDSGIDQVGPQLRDSFVAGSALGSEHYEIAVYSSAVLFAGSLGEEKVAALLSQNLEEEFSAMKKLERIAERLAHEGA